MPKEKTTKRPRRVKKHRIQDMMTEMEITSPVPIPGKPRPTGPMDNHKEE